MSLKIDEPPGINRDAIRDMLKHVCPEADFNIAEDGAVAVAIQNFCDKASAETEILQHQKCCKCICGLIESAKTITLRIRDDLRLHGGGRTIATDNANSVNSVGSNQVVEIENRSRYCQKSEDKLDQMDVPDWLILAHELCGHALPGANGTEREWRPGKPGYQKDWHRTSEQIEDEIRREHGLPNRGTSHRVKQ